MPHDASRPQEFFISADSPDLDPIVRAEVEAIRQQPEFIERIARHARIVSRGQLALAFCVEPLAGGAIAIVRIGQAASALARYAIVSSVDFDDEVYHRALGAAMVYEMQHEGDHSPVTILVFRNGRLQVDSERLGKSETRLQIQTNGLSLDLLSAPLLGRVAEAPLEDVPGYGRLRVLRP